MARTPRIKSSGEGTAYYHLISRCSNRQFLFRKAASKDRLMYRWVWSDNVDEISLFTGFDPGEGRVVQIGEGKVFGSAGFVRMWIAGMTSRHKDAHEVMEFESNETVGYSSHGWRLADAQRERSGLVGKSGAGPSGE